MDWRSNADLQQAEAVLAQLEAEKPSDCPAAHKKALAKMRRFVEVMANIISQREGLSNDHKRVTQGLQVCASRERRREQPGRVCEKIIKWR